MNDATHDDRNPFEGITGATVDAVLPYDEAQLLTELLQRSGLNPSIAMVGDDHVHVTLDWRSGDDE